MTTPRAAALTAVALAAAVSAAAQSRRPSLILTPTAPAAVRPGSTAHLSLAVAMPEAYHVQANKPRDPALIPTVLEVQAPEGTTVEQVVYPEPKEFKLAGSSDVLLVYGPTFTVEVTLRLEQTLAAGTLEVPAVLRYQACDEHVCFAPARATTSWALHVEPGH